MENKKIDQAKVNSINIVKPIFIKYDAISKEKAMMKEEVIAEIEDTAKADQAFKYLKYYGIIKKSHGKYYYCLKNEEKKNMRMKKDIINAAILIFIIVVLSILNVISKSTVKTNDVENDDVSFKIPNTWDVLYDYEAGYGWDYYRYINTTQGSENTINVDTNTVDYSNYPARINVYYTDSSITSIDELKSSLNSYIGDELKPSDYSINASTSKNGYDMVEVAILYSSPEEVEYIYYLLNNSKIAYITAFSYNLNDNTQIAETAKIIADSFQWK